MSNAVVKPSQVWYCHCHPQAMYIPIFPLGKGQCGFCKATEWKLPPNVVVLADWRKEKGK